MTPPSHPGGVPKGRLDASVDLFLLVCAATVLYGLAMVVVGPVVLDTTALGLTDPLIWPGELPPGAITYKRWAHAGIGALASGIASLLGCVAHVELRRGERWAWWAIVLSLTWWMALSAGSAASLGIWPLVWVDGLFYAAFLAPALWIRRHLPPASPPDETGFTAVRARSNRRGASGALSSQTAPLVQGGWATSGNEGAAPLS